jgi:hypothetical protein
VAIATLTATAAVSPNLAKTLEAQRKLAAERPQDAGVFNDLGNLLVLSSRPQEAEAAYRQAIELDPEKASALFNLGLLLQQRGELREAYGLYRRVVKANPGHAWAHYQLGTIQEAWKQQARAVDSYAQAFALDPQLAFPEVNPHVVENKLVTQAMMRAYKNDSTPQAPTFYEDPSRIAAMLVPRPSRPQDQETATAQQQPAESQPANRQPGAPGTAPGAVIRERDLERGNSTGQASGAGMRPGGPQQRGLREWNRPEPTMQEIPNEDVNDENAQPQPVITPPPGGVYYRPGIQSTGRLNLQLRPERVARTGRG